MTLTSVGEPDDAKGKTISEIGSMLFTRGVSGTRVVTGKDTKVIEGYTFKGKNYLHFNSQRVLQKKVEWPKTSLLIKKPQLLSNLW